MRGLFVTFEGPDGCGKSTISNLIYEELIKRGISAIKTREPGGTATGEKIREVLLDKNNRISAETEALLYAASRAQHIDEKINPALDEGKVVICERFILSSLAYQGYGRGLKIEDVENINKFATKNIEPDLIFLFDIDPLITLKRKMGEDADRLELAGDEFHKKVYLGYKDLGKIYNDKINLIDASRSIEEVYSQCIRIIEKKLEEEI